MDANAKKLLDLSDKLVVCDIPGVGRYIGTYDAEKNQVTNAVKMSDGKAASATTARHWFKDMNLGVAESLTLAAGTSIIMKPLNPKQKNYFQQAAFFFDQATKQAMPNLVNATFDGLY